MSQSIGKILDELLGHKISKQEAVTKLQRNRNHALKPLQTRSDGRTSPDGINWTEPLDTEGEWTKDWKGERDGRTDGVIPKEESHKYDELNERQFNLLMFNMKQSDREVIYKHFDNARKVVSDE